MTVDEWGRRYREAHKWGLALAFVLSTLVGLTLARFASETPAWLLAIVGLSAAGLLATELPRQINKRLWRL